MLRTVKIGCFIYEIKEVDCVNKLEPRKGEADFFQRTIKIDRDMTAQDKRETLLHEVIHAVDEFMQIGLEENQVKKLGVGLAMVLLDNPGLLDVEQSS